MHGYELWCIIVEVIAGRDAEGRGDVGGQREVVLPRTFGVVAVEV